jgi:hypothetical protein
MNKIIFSDGTEVPVIEPLEFTPEERVRDIKKCLRPTKEATIETNIYFTPPLCYGRSSMELQSQITI